jgi:chloramphenicol O-acetyltransferase
MGPHGIHVSMVEPHTHYKRNKVAYDTIASALDSVNTAFHNADRFTQKVMLFDSSVYAVTSVQNDISVLRDAFRGYQNADNWDDVRDVMSSVNYGNNKFEYIRSNFDTIFSKFGDNIINLLKQGSVWAAIDNMADRLDGVSYVKAPFIACMLGFTSVMCVDTNVEQMIDDDAVVSSGYRSLDEYKDAVEIVVSSFPNLAEDVSTFMLQWVCFDCNRGNGVARHEEWFEVMVPGSPFGRQTGLAEY